MVASTEGWTIQQIEQLGRADDLGLKVGDVIKTINGKDIEEHKQFVLWHQIEQAQEIGFLREGIAHHVTFSIDYSNLQRHDISSLIIELISLLIASFVFHRGRDRRLESAYYLAFVFLTIAITFMSLGASNRGDILGKNLIGTFIVLVPTVFLHFLIVFFKERNIVDFPKKILKIWYAIIVIGTISRLNFFVDPIAYYIYEYDNYTIIPFFLLSLISNFWFLAKVNNHVKENRSLKSLIRIIWYSIIVSFAPFSILSFLPMLFMQREFVHSFYTSWFVLLFPCSFAYLILSKKLYDIDLYLRRILFTILISLIPTGITVFLVSILYRQSISWLEITYTFIVVLVIFSVFAYTIEYFSTKLEKFMFPRKYFLQQSLKKISRALGSVTNFNALKEIILNDIVNTLEIHGGAIVFVEKDGIQVITAGDIDEEDVKTSMENGIYKGDRYTAFEINCHEEYRSFLVVTGKKSNTHLGQEDQHWINLIVTYLSASLENVYLIRKLTLKMYELMANIPNEEATPEFVWLRKTMYDIQEKERIRIAMDLHDTTMQDLFLLKRRLYPILQRFPKMTDEYGQLTGILTHIDLINENLRQSCFELNPYVLQKTGLVGSIRKLVDVESSYSEFQVEFIADCTAQIELLEVERKKHLFRVIQELLNNAKKHSQAEHVTIRLVEENSIISLFYEDDGVGFDPQLKELNRKNRIISGAGIGLDQMQGRVLLMNGEFYMDTERGKGVQIEIRIPFLEGISA